MVEAKHEFIDDNPYLVYSPDTEATANGSGGAGFPVIEMDDESEELSVTAGELKEMLSKSPVILKRVLNNSMIRWYQIISLFVNENSYDFIGISVSNTEVTKITWSADTANDYPVLQ